MKRSVEIWQSRGMEETLERLIEGGKKGLEFFSFSFVVFVCLFV